MKTKIRRVSYQSARDGVPVVRVSGGVLRQIGMVVGSQFVLEVVGGDSVLLRRVSPAPAVVGLGSSAEKARQWWRLCRVDLFGLAAQPVRVGDSVEGFGVVLGGVPPRWVADSSGMVGGGVILRSESGDRVLEASFLGLAWCPVIDVDAETGETPQ